MTAVRERQHSFLQSGCKFTKHFESNFEKTKRTVRYGSTVAWWLMPRTPDPEVGGSSYTRVKPCCVLDKANLLPKSTGNTQEAVAPSQHD